MISQNTLYNIMCGMHSSAVGLPLYFYSTNRASMFDAIFAPTWKLLRSQRQFIETHDSEHLKFFKMVGQWIGYWHFTFFTRLKASLKLILERFINSAIAIEFERLMPAEQHTILPCSLTIERHSTTSLL